MEDPRAALVAIGSLVGRQPDVDAVLRGHRLTVTQGHTLAGNPARFGPSVVTIEADDEWRLGLTPTDRRTVDLLTWPTRRRYGY